MGLSIPQKSGNRGLRELLQCELTERWREILSGAWGEQSDGDKLGKEFMLGWILKGMFCLTL